MNQARLDTPPPMYRGPRNEPILRLMGWKAVL
jgi:hypothetical protein